MAKEGGHIKTRGWHYKLPNIHVRVHVYARVMGHIIPTCPLRLDGSTNEFDYVPGSCLPGYTTKSSSGKQTFNLSMVLKLKLFFIIKS